MCVKFSLRYIQQKLEYSNFKPIINIIIFSCDLNSNTQICQQKEIPSLDIVSIQKLNQLCHQNFAIKLKVFSLEIM